MIRIGIVDLDTSHPQSFVDVLKGYDDLAVTAVWDGGAVHPKGYAQEFAAKNGIPNVCDELEQMVDLVDLAMVLGVDWDFHLMRSEPFIKAGKLVYIDKPAVGKTAHCDRLLEWENQYAAKVMAGSSVRYAREIQELKSSIADFGEIRSVFGCGPVDSFFYGIHVAEMLQGFLGTGAKSVRFIGACKDTQLFSIHYDDGPVCVMQVATPTYQFHISVYGEKKNEFVTLGPDLYSPFLEKFVGFARTGEPPIPLKDALEAVRIMIATKCCSGLRDPVHLSDLHDCAGFDGWEHADAYAAAARRRLQQ